MTRKEEEEGLPMYFWSIKLSMKPMVLGSVAFAAAAEAAPSREAGSVETADPLRDEGVENDWEDDEAGGGTRNMACMVADDGAREARTECGWTEK